MYFFEVILERRPGDHKKEICVMVCLLSAPDPCSLERSSGALQLCYYPERSNFAVFPAKSVQAVVAALPDPIFPGYFSILEQLGTNLRQSTGVSTEDTPIPNCGDDSDGEEMACN